MSRHKSCSSIRKNQVPQPSTDTNDIILKMLYAIAKGMDQNIVALHPTNGMLDKEANATQGGIGNLLFIAQLWVGILLTLAWLPRRDVNVFTTVIRLNAEIAEIDPHMQVNKPIQRRWKLLLQHEVIVIVPAEGATKKNNKLVRQCHDRVLQRMLFFFRCNAPVASPHLANDDTPVRWHQ